jgi:hypothetical protein
MVGGAATVSTCAGCGVQSTNQEHWARRHDLLLCPECDAALGFLSDTVGLRVSTAEHEWERLWQEVDEVLGKCS